MPDTIDSAARDVTGPPPLDTFAHVSFPCRDLAEGKKFYGEVLGGRQTVDTPTFASFAFGAVQIGIGTVGCTWSEPRTEYPHCAFYVEADTLVRMKAWLAKCGVPTSDIWTRQGVEALMFFRDPSGNVLELYCREGFKGANQLPKGGPQGNGIAVDLAKLLYTEWKPPVTKAG